jgi:hypothetical protein
MNIGNKNLIINILKCLRFSFKMRIDKKENGYQRTT